MARPSRSQKKKKKKKRKKKKKKKQDLGLVSYGLAGGIERLKAPQDLVGLERDSQRLSLASPKGSCMAGGLKRHRTSALRRSTSLPLHLTESRLNSLPARSPFASRHLVTTLCLSLRLSLSLKVFTFLSRSLC